MRFTLILVAAALATTAAPGFAAEVASRTVGYGDLNLGKDAGAAMLKQRVRSAATAVCGIRDVQDLAGSVRARACVDGAMSTATPAVRRAIATARGA